MRASHLVISRVIPFLSAGVLGCGGGGSARPDAPPPVDAFMCSQSGTLNATSVVDFSQSSGQAQGAVPTNGTQLQVLALIFNNDTGLIIRQVNNGGVFSAAAGKAGRFEQPPAPGTYPMDTDLNVVTLGFGIDFVNGIAHGAGGTTINPTQVALLDATAGGTVRIDSFAPAATPGGTSTIAATITNAKFKGYNVISGSTVDTTGNGCDITLQNLQFTGLSVKWQAAAFPPIAPPPAQPDLAARPDLAAWPLDGAAAVSADFRLE
jgi:hypothetical protein